MSVLPWHRRQWAGLRAALAAGRLPHALLLTGPDGIGLGEFALTFARALLCERAPAPDGAEKPCGQCRACVLSQAGNHPDILRVAPAEAGRQIRVDEIRALLEFMHLSSQSGRAKAAIIEPADAMNRSAANGLLKTLEEPPPGAVLMLCSHQPGRLPITIRSRCQQVAFSGDQGAEACAWVAARLDLDPAAATDLLRRAGGAPFRAVALAESDVVPKQARLIEDLCRLLQQPGNPVPVAQQ
jgi:DNA polymerase-3 subunit delta'